MNKKDFLKRCETAYEKGLCDFVLLRDWVDAVMRFESGQTEGREHQLRYWKEFVEKERERTDGFKGSKVLANDIAGYKIIEFVAIFAHPCQQCAEDKEAWHTRSGFCDHNK